MRGRRALIWLIILVTVLTAGDTAFAQDAIPETPPELRDFRLDPPRPTPQPAPTAEQPVVAPPPAVSTVPDRQIEQSRPQPERPRDIDRPAARDTETPVVDPRPETVQRDAAAPEIAADDLPAPVADAEPAANRAITAFPYWQVAGGGLGLVTILLLAWFWFGRRRRSTDRADILAVEPEALEPAKAPEPVLANAIPIPPQSRKKPKVTLDFVPEKATVSFNSLTVKGQLRLINEGDAPAKNMELRAGLISASAMQDRLIGDFYRSGEGVRGEPLGDAKPGERIGMAIELSVPLTDMESFMVGNQKLLVPIMVANLSYGSGSVTDTARIACMIGREATPPTVKMGALRLDLGPRSFASLGQRPVHA